jgi:hypothetical protein
MILRGQVLVAMFQLVTWTLRRAKVQAAARPERGRAWRMFRAGLADYWTTDREHLASYRAAMMTLSEYLREGR